MAYTFNLCAAFLGLTPGMCVRGLWPRRALSRLSSLDIIPWGGSFTASMALRGVAYLPHVLASGNVSFSEECFSRAPVDTDVLKCFQC